MPLLLLGTTRLQPNERWRAAAKQFFSYFQKFRTMREAANYLAVSESQARKCVSPLLKLSCLVIKYPDTPKPKRLGLGQSYKCSDLGECVF